jgi:hypothetical protein
MCGRVCRGGTDETDSWRTRVAAWERGDSLDREDCWCFCSFLGELWTKPKMPRLARRLELEVFLLWPGPGEAPLDAVEADQRLRLRKLSLKPPALLDRDEGRRGGRGSRSCSDWVVCALKGSWKVGRVFPDPESGWASDWVPGAILGGGRREEVRGRWDDVGFPGADLLVEMARW